MLKVSTTIASAIGGRDRIRISLMSEAAAGEIGDQIRGEFVEVETVAEEVAELVRPTMESEPIETKTDVELAPQPSDSPSDAQTDVKFSACRDIGF